MKINKLKRQREKLGFTQKQVSVAAKISERLYQRYEADECLPNIHTAMEIAKILNSTCEELFTKE